VFTGWVPFRALTVTHLPDDRGVYVVMQPAGAPRPVFLTETVGGPHKKRSLSRPTAELSAA